MSSNDAPPDFGRRVFTRRTAVSLALSLALIGLLLTRVQIDVARTVQIIRSADLSLYLAAFAVYYLVFPVRALRWRRMLGNAGYDSAQTPSLPRLATIIFLSWFVNCLVPAKLGDVYRAYLLKQDGRGSLTKAGGTIVAERIIDFTFVLVLLAITGAISFHGRLPDSLAGGLEVGAGLALLAGAALLAMWRHPALIRRALPEHLHAIYSRFNEGTIGAFGGYRMLILYTALAWLVEMMRLFLVVRATGVHLDGRFGVELTLVAFIALVSSLFTAPPGLPAGLGYVEASIVAALVLVGQPMDMAVSIALLDRSISYVSLVVFGFVVYLVSRYLRSHRSR
ncbi:MAG: flippase-like domain-containing protein [Chloroflexi bacterium]|nr:flippase-like domain-containing protein [Chloroflexota bacterium]